MSPSPKPRYASKPLRRQCHGCRCPGAADHGATLHAASLATACVIIGPVVRAASRNARRESFMPFTAQQTRLAVRMDTQVTQVLAEGGDEALLLSLPTFSTPSSSCWRPAPVRRSTRSAISMRAYAAWRHCWRGWPQVLPMAASQCRNKPDDPADAASVQHVTLLTSMGQTRCPRHKDDHPWHASTCMPLPRSTI